jgi:hypothetical protein
MAEIRDAGDERGRVLVAVEAAVPGSILVDEPPVLLVSPPGQGESWRPLPAVFATAGLEPEVWATLLSYRHAGPAVRSEVRSFFSPLDTPKSIALRAVLQTCCVPSVTAAETLVVPEIELPLDECLQVQSAFQMNAVVVTLPPADGGSGVGITLGLALYALCCRASHACRPTCVWLPTANGHRVLRALVPISANDELTIDYTGGRDVLLPINERRAFLQRTKAFQCQCIRCGSTGDDTRRFACCATASCRGIHEVATASPGDQLLPCSICMHPPSPSQTQAVLAMEADTRDALTTIRRLRDLGAADVTARVYRLQAPHPWHHLTDDVFALKWEQAQLMAAQEHPGAWASAEKAALARLACVDAVCPWPSRIVAFRCELVGDAASGPVDASHDALMRALAAYRRAVRILDICEGPESSYAASAGRKLIAVQRRLPPASLLVHHGCGFCSSTDGPLHVCGRCQGVRYCCRLHQQAQWPLHKKNCHKI